MNNQSGINHRVIGIIVLAKMVGVGRPSDIAVLATRLTKPQRRNARRWRDFRRGLQVFSGGRGILTRKISQWCSVGSKLQAPNCAGTRLPYQVVNCQVLKSLGCQVARRAVESVGAICWRRCMSPKRRAQARLGLDT